MLRAEELTTLEATLLPALERHHLRLLAHGLRTLQSIAGEGAATLPTPPQIHQWALAQPACDSDDAFAKAFAQQMEGLAAQLQAIAGPGHNPLSLELADLIRWAQQQADQRIAGGL